ncbi:MAG: hypothetical protein COV44_09185 [Deltaproteobacteria bacterium CG11_big_fil_rev_8_21_14_0_20_45_16]|nr:MAG: hypothetical protein COV44_09185 [Deltaproteobacteria bacterium CG11_big_fil_rev_8_21_14_0_20_45_16]
MRQVFIVFALFQLFTGFQNLSSAASEKDDSFYVSVTTSDNNLCLRPSKNETAKLEFKNNLSNLVQKDRHSNCPCKFSIAGELLDCKFARFNGKALGKPRPSRSFYISQ